MKRNLDHRLELLFPIRDPRIRQRLIWILSTCLEDNVSSWELLPDGKYKAASPKGRLVRAQERFYEEALAASDSVEHSGYRFRPLTHSKTNPQPNPR